MPNSNYNQTRLVLITATLHTSSSSDPRPQTWTIRPAPPTTESDRLRHILLRIESCINNHLDERGRLIRMLLDAPATPGLAHRIRQLGQVIEQLFIPLDRVIGRLAAARTIESGRGGCSGRRTPEEERLFSLGPGRSMVRRRVGARREREEPGEQQLDGAWDPGFWWNEFPGSNIVPWQRSRDDETISVSVGGESEISELSE
ncbi:hypothetical protein K461DRAFT_267959 [Myriangium duriaei CBS 260.36]|uniref:Uncharacterized protein n=1 Tax=Myriangium duriaei CBS 260.36 TaxID=1168546 RepID=A0A9P4J6M7_9PEZI|nr:hypothetical protein K461DRAFT_267959 [Myriangium duriaei CBS 260.36]